MCKKVKYFKNLFKYKDLGKMNCERNSLLLGGSIAGANGIPISNAVEGRCGRCSTGESGDPAGTCDTYTGGYCDA